MSGTASRAASRVLGLALASALCAAPAFADPKPPKPPLAPPPLSRGPTEPAFEVLLPDPDPAPTRGEPGESAADSSTELDIASQVLSAAKQVTTVQEAPSIITVITDEEIRNRGYRNLNQALSTIPGWMNAQGVGNQLDLPLVRGTAQAALLLRDGVSMFEPVLNAGMFNNAIPMETLKRIEVVTGPGGVLWGANSFLGIVNTISKEAEDINGIEGGVGYGDGTGQPQDFRAWVLFGKSIPLPRGPNLRIVQHFSYESFQSSQQTGPLTLYTSPSPQPAGPNIYDGTLTSNTNRSYIFDLDGRISYGPVTLSYFVPFADLNDSVTFGNTIVGGSFNPATGRPTGTSAQNRFTVVDRYGVLQYKDRFLGDRIGFDTKLYGIQFVRDVEPSILPGSPNNPTGLSFAGDLSSYRVGGTIDGDAALPFHNRLLFGGEVFHEWVPSAQVSFPNPLTPSAVQVLPLACPLAPGSTYSLPVYVPGCPLPFINAANRTVLALYLSDQFRPVSRLVLDAGVRYQAGLGERAYHGANFGDNGQLLGSASIVWNFYADMHLKANYATGFRPPVFNNTDSYGPSVQFSGNKNLTNERSQAFQVEWNARLLKNIAAIRELQLRADYSYTQLDSLIVISDGSYSNTNPTTGSPTRRAINSVEGSARLYLKDHVISAGYTFLHIDTDDRGVLRSMPQHWLSLGAVFSLIPGFLSANATLNLIASYDDPNRFQSISVPGGTTLAPYSDLTFDRLPPQAILNLGLRATFLQGRLWCSANVYNALNQQYYHPDVFYDLTPTLETTPTPAPGYSFFLQVGGKPWGK